jgi:hypothetical protein
MIPDTSGPGAGTTIRGDDLYRHAGHQAIRRQMREWSSRSWSFLKHVVFAIPVSVSPDML